MDCLTFFFPNDPLYRVQLIQAYRYFGMWVAWERDTGKTALLAAEAWQEAIAESEANDFMPSVTVENVINVNNEGCGCCSGGGGTVVIDPTIEINLPDPVDPDDDYSEDSGEPDPPDRWVGTYPTWNEFNDAKCRAANYYADNVLANLNVLRNVFGGLLDTSIGRIVAALTLLVLDGPLPFLDAAALAILLIPNISDWIEDQTSDASEIATFILTVDKCTLVDLIYDANDADGMGVDIANYLKGLTAGLSPTLKTWLDKYIDYAFTSRLANYIYTNMDTLVPSGYAIECPCGPMAAAWLLDLEDQSLAGVSLDGGRYSVNSSGRSLSLETTTPLTGTASIKMAMTSFSGFTGVDMRIEPSNTTSGSVSLDVGDTIEWDFSVNDTGGTQRSTVLIYQAGGSTTSQLGVTGGAIIVNNGTASYTVQSGDPVGLVGFIKILTNTDDATSAPEWIIDNVRILKP